MRISWITYLDPFAFSGGGEMHNRLLIEVGRGRGHDISVSPWLRNRPQRVLRRLGVNRRLQVDWDADAFVLANIRNHGHRDAPLPARIVEKALATGRSVVVADAWVDVCTLSLPCHGDPARCAPECSKSWGNSLYEAARAAVFVSPMQHRLVEAVLDAPMPQQVIYSRPQIDTNAFRPLGLERDIDVLYVGTIRAEKGYYELLERFGEDRLTLVGRSCLDEAVRGTWLGSVPYERLPEIYNRAKTFAHLPLWAEPMGRTVVEAALCGCELELNDRVGVTSYPEEDWREPRNVSVNAHRFWAELEAALSEEGTGVS